MDASQGKQAQILTTENEEIFWSKGMLGDHTPQSLLDTIVFCNGLFFTLRSRREHQQLRSLLCKIEVVEQSGERLQIQIQAKWQKASNTLKTFEEPPWQFEGEKR